MICLLLRIGEVTLYQFICFFKKIYETLLLLKIWSKSKLSLYFNLIKSPIDTGCTDSFHICFLLCEILLYGFCPFLNWVESFLTFRSALHIFETNLLLAICIFNIVFMFVAYILSYWRFCLQTEILSLNIVIVIFRYLVFHN